MYELVPMSEFKSYQKICSSVLQKTCKILLEEGISASFMLVGSGARNLVTRNGSGPYDLDYNLLIQKADNCYWSNLARMKNTVRCALDKAACNFQFKQSQDSTSVLTVLLHYEGTPNLQFSFDVAIVSRNTNGNLQRLIHNKRDFSNSSYISSPPLFLTPREIRVTEEIIAARRNRWPSCYQQPSENTDHHSAAWYTWNEVPDSNETSEKAKSLKAAGKWQDVRKSYVDLKNLYLSRQDHDHPSFIVYVEAVNEVYNKLPQVKGRTK